MQKNISKIREKITKFKNKKLERSNVYYYYLKISGFALSLTKFQFYAANSLLCVKSSNIDEAVFSFRLLAYVMDSLSELPGKTDISNNIYTTKEPINGDKFTFIFSFEKILKNWFYPRRYFISAPSNITSAEFKENIAPKILETFNKDKESKYLVDDSDKTGVLIQDYLHDVIKTKNVVIYHTKSKPRNNVYKYPVLGYFTNIFTRDAAMTKSSDEDICWTYSPEHLSSLYGLKYDPDKKNNVEMNIERRDKYRKLYVS